MTSLAGLTGAQLVLALRGLDSEAAQLHWERCSVSQHSPGPVADTEEVVRCCDTPVHINLDGSLTPAAFSDVESIGLSVNRVDSHGLEKLWTAADRRLAERAAQRAREGKPADNRRAMALASLEVAALRSLHQTDGARMFGVYDTGLPNDPHHADLVCLHAEKQRIRSARAKLYGLARITMRTEADDPSVRPNN